jgi:hypothetical protein
MGYKVVYLVKTYNIHVPLVVNTDQIGLHVALMVNIDETKLHLMPITWKHTWEIKGAKHITVSRIEDKR